VWPLRTLLSFRDRTQRALTTELELLGDKTINLSPLFPVPIKKGNRRRKALDGPAVNVLGVRSRKLNNVHKIKVVWVSDQKFTTPSSSVLRKSH
jgi:hypothetical protein